MADSERPDDQTIGGAASEPPGRRRADEGDAWKQRTKDGERSLYDDVPGQSSEPAGDGA
jgi:hypothetical protein